MNLDIHCAARARVAGVIFLLYLALGQLPALFALPAGRRAALWFTVFGLTDLVVAVTLGALTGFGLLHVTPSSAPITELPLAKIAVALPRPR